MSSPPCRSARGGRWTYRCSPNMDSGRCDLPLKTSVLGDGLLERTRSTSLALLGLTAAIGLTMVALALNQGWPLIAGAPIPGFGSEHQAVGEAAVVAKARGGRAAISAAAGQARPGVSSGKPRRTRGGTARWADRKLPGLQVSSSPIRLRRARRRQPARRSGPGSDAVAPTTCSHAAPAPAPAAVPVSSSNSSSPGPAPETTPESPIPSQAPPAGDEGDEHGHGHTGHGHGHSHGRDDSATSESSEIPKRRPAPTKRLRQKPTSPKNPKAGSHMRRHGVTVAATATAAGSSGRCTAG